jgi:cytochrome c-type biogenesis protein CcmH/NrfF
MEMLWIYATVIAGMGFVLVKVRRRRKQRQAQAAGLDATRRAA